MRDVVGEKIHRDEMLAWYFTKFGEKTSMSNTKILEEIREFDLAEAKGAYMRKFNAIPKPRWTEHELWTAINNQMVIPFPAEVDTIEIEFNADFERLNKKLEVLLEEVRIDRASGYYIDFKSAAKKFAETWMVRL